MQCTTIATDEGTRVRQCFFASTFKHARHCSVCLFFASTFKHARHSSVCDAANTRTDFEAMFGHNRLSFRLTYIYAHAHVSVRYAQAHVHTHCDKHTHVHT